MSTKPGLWAHLPGTHYGHFDVVVAPVPTRRAPARARPRWHRQVPAVLVLVGIVLLAFATIEPSRAEAQTVEELVPRPVVVRQGPDLG